MDFFFRVGGPKNGKNSEIFFRSKSIFFDSIALNTLKNHVLALGSPKTNPWTTFYDHSKFQNLPQKDLAIFFSGPRAKKTFFRKFFKNGTDMLVLKMIRERCRF